MRSADRWAGGLFLLLGIFVLTESRKLDYGGTYGAGDGFFPFWLGITIAVLSAVLIFQTFRNSETRQDATGERAEWKKKSFAYIALVVFMLAIQIFGFIICFTALVASLLLVIEREPWPRAAFTAAASGVGFYLFFIRLLEVRLPLGPFGF